MSVEAKVPIVQRVPTGGCRCHAPAESCQSTGGAGDPGGRPTSRRGPHGSSAKHRFWALRGAGFALSTWRPTLVGCDFTGSKRGDARRGRGHTQNHEVLEVQPVVGIFRGEPPLRNHRKGPRRPGTGSYASRLTATPGFLRPSSTNRLSRSPGDQGGVRERQRARSHAPSGPGTGRDGGCNPPGQGQTVQRRSAREGLHRNSRDGRQGAGSPAGSTLTRGAALCRPIPPDHLHHHNYMQKNKIHLDLQIVSLDFNLSGTVMSLQSTRIGRGGDRSGLTRSRRR